ncbi:hypothetical protein [Sphingobacterium hungaricum]|uniref:Uncharacterized protein n=1 Tax=Sphingobacterium hungaricum TaxID=2082723 RepID=A0A928UWJ2_9SPHI|nr:hypothetical protein [Sphingobacterium hungaricum]MBE8712067.1 hypothetical protein [Sphingobacterium hungaricum]
MIKSKADTNLYLGHYPPENFIRENFKDAPFILEGDILQVDSVSGFEKVIVFKIDSVWKGDILEDTIQYATSNDLRLNEYTYSRQIVFLQKQPKVKYYTYTDSIEYFPIGENTVWSLDKEFKRYLLDFSK